MMDVGRFSLRRLTISLASHWGESNGLFFYDANVLNGRCQAVFNSSSVA